MSLEEVLYLLGELGIPRDPISSGLAASAVEVQFSSKSTRNRDSYYWAIMQNDGKESKSLASPSLQMHLNATKSTVAWTKQFFLHGGGVIVGVCEVEELTKEYA